MSDINHFDYLLVMGLTGEALELARKLGEEATRLQDLDTYCGDTWYDWAWPLVKEFCTVVARGSGFGTTCLFPLHIQELTAKGHSVQGVYYEPMKNTTLNQIQMLWSWVYLNIYASLARGRVPEYLLKSEKAG